MNVRALTLSPIALALGLAISPASRAQEHVHGHTAAPVPVVQEHSVDHAAMGHDQATRPAQDPAKTGGHAGHDPRAANGTPVVDHAAMGHDTTASPHQAQPVDHSMHHSKAHPAPIDHAAMGHGTPPPTPVDHAAMGHAVPPAEPRDPIPALTAAERAAAFPDLVAHTMHDQHAVRFVQFNRLEAWEADAGTGFAWEGLGWFGNDHHKLWLRSEGEREPGHAGAADRESADLEVLYGRPLARWWDVVAGIRHDFQPGAAQSWAAIGVIGLAPQKFEVEATAYVGASGRTAARVEVEYELLLSNRLILQPLIEFNLFGKDDPRRGLGSGLSTAEAGLRLRYEFTRRFAPYLGVVHERAFGGTADRRREEGEDTRETRFVAGVRVWF